MDHIIPLIDKRKDPMNNLQALHRICHQKKTSFERFSRNKEKERTKENFEELQNKVKLKSGAV
jgi:5-methylcytosine-specific restriction endonuclease McrA